MTIQTRAFEQEGRNGLLRIEQLPPKARFSVRVRAGEAAELGRRLGVRLPERLGAISDDEGFEAIRLGPDEWCLLAPESGRETLIRSAEAAYASVPHAFCDISDRETTLRLSGAGASIALAAGIARDFGAIGVGCAARTLFDTATVILWRDGEDSFRLDVWRSFAPHVQGLLTLVEEEIAAGI